MASKIILKKSSVADKAPVAGDLDFGELAINYTDSKLYFKKADGSIDAFTSAVASAPVTSVGGNTGAITDTQLLNSIKNVDGAGSGLDADFLDGLNASSFYLASNPNGYTSNTGTVTSVGATTPLVSSGGNTPSISIPAANSSTNGYMSAAYASKLDGIAAGATNVTNNNQLANGAGYITSAALSNYLPLSGGTLSGDITVTRIRGVNNLVLDTYTTVNPSSNVFLYSQPNDRDSWLYLDSADTGSNWGIYHRQIDSAVSGLPGNSIGFVGGGSSTLQAWISLANGSANFAGALTQAGNQVLHAGNYTGYSPSLSGSGASGTWGINISGNAATATSADQIDGIPFRNTGSNSGVNANTLASNGITYYTDGVPNFSGNATDGALYSQAYSGEWQHQIAGDYRSGQIAVRGKNSGTWQSWRKILQEDSWQGNKYFASNGEIYGTIFYDSNDSSYYTNPNETSNLSRVTLTNGNLALTQGDGTGLRITTAYGYINFGAQNSSWTHVYADRPFYTNQDWYVNGNLIHHDGNAGRARNSNLMYYQGFSLDANTMDTNATGFTYSNNAPSTGPIARFSTGGGGYDLWLNASYVGGNHLHFRTRNGDAGTYNSWRVVPSYGVNYSDSLYASIYYDADDTGYYIDPNSTGTSYRGRGEIFLGPNSSNEYLRVGGNGGLADHSTVSTSNGNLHIDAKSGNSLYLAWYNNSNVMVGGGIQATIYYDRNDTGYYVDPASTSRLNLLTTTSIAITGSSNDRNVVRVIPKNAAASYNGTVTGAFKIRLPVRAIDTMWQMTVKIYNYNNNDISEYKIGSYSYLTGAYNTAASFDGSGNSSPQTVRIGNDGTYDCVWIGETNSSWSHPVIAVTEFVGGYYNATAENWDDNWEVSVVTSFGTVGTAISPTNKVYAVTAASSMYSPIFYDSNDTNYYVDPNSTSRIRKTNLIASGSGWDDGLNLYSADQTNRWNFLTDLGASNSLRIAYNNSEALIINSSRNITAHVDIRTPIFYDSNDTSYYVDPNSTSYQRSLFLGAHDSGTSEFRFGEDSSGWFGDRWYWDSGYNLYRYSRHAGTDSLIHYHDTRDPSRITYGRNIVFDDYGKGIVGTYSASRYQGVFAMGDSYKLAVDGTSTGSLYGIAWSHPNAGGVASNLNTHGALIMENGTFLAALSGSIRSRDDMRSPIFYDSNDTGYYVDASSTSRLNNVLANNGDWYGATYFYANRDTTSSSPALQAYSNNGSGAIMSFHRAGYYAVNFGLDSDNVMRIGGWSAATNRWQLDMSGNNWVAGSSRAPIFYDSDNTDYYADPSATSNLNVIRGQQITARTHGLSCAYFAGNNTPSTGYLITTNIDYGVFNMPKVIIEGYAYGNAEPIHLEIVWYAYADSWSNHSYTNLGAWNPGTVRIGTNANGKVCIHLENNIYYPRMNVRCIYDQGQVYLENWSISETSYTGLSRVVGVPLKQIRSGINTNNESYVPILYDTNNTAYYVDPNSTSNLAGLTVANTITGSVTGNAGTVAGLAVHANRNNEANKIVRTDGDGYIQAGWINTISGDNGTASIDRVYASNDGYLRYYTPANFRTVLDVPTKSGSGATGNWGIQSATVKSWDGYGRNGTGMAAFYNWGGTNAGSNPPDGSTYTTGIDVGSNPSDQDYGFQIASNMWNVGLWTRTYNSGFSSWVRLLDSSNYSSYALPISGGTLTGNLGIGLAPASNWSSLWKPLQLSTSSVAGWNSTSFQSVRLAVNASGTSTINVGMTAAAYIEAKRAAAFQIIPTTGTINAQFLWMTAASGTAGAAITWTYPMVLDQNGYLLIGYSGSNGAYGLQVNGQIFATSSTIATSDSRYKEKVETLTGALDVVKALRPVVFNWKDHSVHKFDSSIRTIGFLAQEVEEVLAEKPYLNSVIKRSDCVIEPEVLNEDGEVIKAAVKEEFLGIAEGNVIALLTRAVQEQQAIIEAQEERLARLESIVSSLTGE